MACAADSLQRRRHSASAANDEDAIDESDVDAEFEAGAADDGVEFAGAQRRFDAVPHAAFERRVVHADARVVSLRSLLAFDFFDRLVVAGDLRHLVRNAFGLTAHVRKHERRAHVRRKLARRPRDGRKRRNRAGRTARARRCWMLRRPRRSRISHSRPSPATKFATRSSGATVAERPTRLKPFTERRSSDSSKSESCDPRLFPASACTSSMTTVSSRRRPAPVTLHRQASRRATRASSPRYAAGAKA